VESGRGAATTTTTTTARCLVMFRKPADVTTWTSGSISNLKNLKIQCKLTNKPPIPILLNDDFEFQK
jgi:hypothetical protein